MAFTSPQVTRIQRVGYIISSSMKLALNWSDTKLLEYTKCFECDDHSCEVLCFSHGIQVTLPDQRSSNVLGSREIGCEMCTRCGGRPCV